MGRAKYVVKLAVNTVDKKSVNSHHMDAAIFMEMALQRFELRNSYAKYCSLLLLMCCMKDLQI